MKKTYKIILLPAERGTGSIGQIPSNKSLYIAKQETGGSFSNVDIDHLEFNLHILSDEEIKEGDWVYENSSISEYISQVRRSSYGNLYHFRKTNIPIYHSGINKSNHSAKKAIASTDKSLNLPGIPQEYLEYYISEYNKRHIIEEIKLEILNKCPNTNGENHKLHLHAEGWYYCGACEYETMGELKLKDNEVIRVMDEFADIKSKLIQEQIDEINWDAVRDLKAKGLPVIFDTSMKLDKKIKEQSIEEAAYLKGLSFAKPYFKEFGTKVGLGDIANIYENGFMAGAKHQASKVYTEEEVFSLIESFAKNAWSVDNIILEDRQSRKEWFEENKKNFYEVR